MFAKHTYNNMGSGLRTLPFFFLLCLFAVGAPLIHAEEKHSADSHIVSEWRDTKEKLLQDVLDYLAAGRLDSLSAITVSPDDYRTLVWPELPVSNPRNNLPFEYVFGRHNEISRGGLALKLREFKDRKLELVRFEERPERDRYDHIRIIPIGEVTVNDKAGTTSAVRIAGSILEYKGKFKVFSYKTD